MIDVIFGDYRSYTDFGLVLEDMDIPPASPKTNYVDIPGGDGSIDLTEAFGEVKYNDRELEFAFSCRKEDFETKKRIVANAIHGKRMRVSTTVDPGYYYQGRVYIDSYETSAVFGRIIVKAIVGPYKHHGEKVSQRISAPGSGTVTNGGIKHVVPDIVSTVPCDVTMNGITKPVHAGKSRFVELSLLPGDNDIVVSNVGSMIQRPFEFELKHGNPYVFDAKYSLTGDVIASLSFTGQDEGITVKLDKDNGTEAGILISAGVCVLENLSAGEYTLVTENDSDNVYYGAEYIDENGNVRKISRLYNDSPAPVVAEGGYIKLNLYARIGGGAYTETVHPRILDNNANVVFSFTERDL